MTQAVAQGDVRSGHHKIYILYSIINKLLPLIAQGGGRSDHHKRSPSGLLSLKLSSKLSKNSFKTSIIFK